MSNVSYHKPGVYTQETLLPLTDSSSGPSQAVAAFVGVIPLGGPAVPTRVTSWLDYVSKFGDFGDTTSLFPFSVYEFFNNGGDSCYISRAVNPNAVAASVDLTDAPGTGDVAPAEPMLHVVALSPGTWGNSLAITVTARATGTFDLLVLRGNFVKERFTDLSLDPSSGAFVENIINAPSGVGSQYIQVRSLATSPWDVSQVPAPVQAVSLTGGTEGTGTPDLIAATKALEVLPYVLNINLPGVTSGAILNPLTQWAQTLNRVFFVIDVPKTDTLDNSASATTKFQALLTGGDAVTSTSFAAAYGPWQIFADPASVSSGATRLLPVGGAVLGQYLATDARRGPQKAAAGVRNIINGSLSPTVRFVDSDLETLNDAGINIIRFVQGAGIVIMGARTLAYGYPDRYVAIRRTLMQVERGLVANSLFALFEPNDAALWLRISQVLNQYLTTLYGAGVLRGATAREAFFVKCDAENNPQSSAGVGIVNVQVGLALAASAEFIIINVSQLTASAA